MFVPLCIQVCMPTTLDPFRVQSSVEEDHEFVSSMNHTSE